MSEMVIQYSKTKLKEELPITGNLRKVVAIQVMQLRVMQWSQHFCRLYLACRLRCGKEIVNVMIMSLVERPLSR